MGHFAVIHLGDTPQTINITQVAIIQYLRYAVRQVPGEGGGAAAFAYLIAAALAFRNI